MEKKPSLWAALLARFRQLLYPREFRIAPSIWPPNILQVLDTLLHTSPPPPPVENGSAEKEHLRFLADVGTGLWRLRQKMVQPGTNQPLDEMRRAYRHLESVWDALTEAGVHIRDHTGEPFPEGGIYALKAIAFQPTPGILRETVMETIKPTI